MKTRSRTILRSARGFTLLELLVAVALLALLLVLMTSMASHTASISSKSQQRMTADSEGRQALDRISEDFSRAFIRDDLGERIVKEPGNDELGLYAQTDGYTGDRGISRIAYRIAGTTGGLVRGAEGLSWTGTNQVDFGTTGFAAITADNEEFLAKDVFRFEIAFLMTDGRILAAVSDLGGDSGVAAVLVGMAALDPQMRGLTTEDLPAKFPDALDGRDLLSLWTETMDGSTFRADLPKPTVNAIRIYQRSFPVR